jgi:hypothetical protein
MNMSDKATDPQKSSADDRRAFLNRVGKAAATAPAPHRCSPHRATESKGIVRHKHPTSA